MKTVGSLVLLILIAAGAVLLAAVIVAGVIAGSVHFAQLVQAISRFFGA